MYVHMLMPVLMRMPLLMLMLMHVLILVRVLLLALRDWRPLDGRERAALGLEPSEVFNARKCVDTCKYVELKVQQWAKCQPELLPLWVFDGFGRCRGEPAYKVGMHLIPHQRDGSLPGGYIRTID